LLPRIKDIAKGTDMAEITRRTVLKGAGATLALPMMESMFRGSAFGADAPIPARMCVCHFGIGMNVREFFPKEAGPDCELPRILKPLERHRSDMTVLSGTMLEHGGGHSGDYTFLTGAEGLTSSGITNSISADQVVAERVGKDTRFPSLQMSIKRGTGYGNQGLATLSWNQNGIPLAAENDPSAIFAKLFKVDNRREAARRKDGFRRQSSILDYVRGQARQMEKSVSASDRVKLDEYFTSVREIESQLQRNVDWSTRQKPSPSVDGLGDYGTPITMNSQNFDYSQYAKLMFDLIAIAFQTDSTRVITYNVRTEGGEIFPVHGVSKGYHALTHHNNDPKNLDELAKVDEINMGFWAGFLDRLKSIQDADGRPLLDRTMLAYSGGMGMDHSRDQLPTAFFGGKALGVKHQTHLQLPEKTPLATLWHTMADRMGVQIDSLQDSKGPIRELVG
jgi:hypothetical protein